MYKLLKKDNDLERQTRELAIQYRRAPADQRDVLKKQLEELVEEHFGVRQQRRQLELKRLEQELDRLRTALQRRNEARQQIVKQRTGQLLGENDLDF